MTRLNVSLLKILAWHEEIDVVDPGLRDLLYHINCSNGTMIDFLSVCHLCLLPEWVGMISSVYDQQSLFGAFDTMKLESTATDFSSGRQIVYVWLFREGGELRHDFGLYVGSTKDAAKRIEVYEKQFRRFKTPKSRDTRKYAIARATDLRVYTQGRRYKERLAIVAADVTWLSLSRCYNIL